MKVIALIADIVQSKEIPEREQFQKKISSILSSLNNESTGVISPYTITLGDEFQAVYENADNLIKDIIHIICKLYPVRIRFSIGINVLTTELNDKSALGMDGPAFHIARDGIEILKKYDFSIIQIYDGKNDKFEFVNKSLMLNFLIMASWKENTMKIFEKLSNENKVKDMINEMDISQRGIYKIINTNKLLNYVEYFGSIKKEIKEKIEE
ncbi:MAG: hypothetical protein JEZ04_18620 [Spirochaetales bacterium]|nr:hypothetical protein [Spirochaetales bacterium]